MKKTEFLWDDDTIETVIEMLDEYFKIYGNSECIAQGDAAQQRAAEILCEIADQIIPIN